MQLLKEFNCTVTSTWTNNDDNCEFSGLQETTDDIYGAKGYPFFDVVPEQSKTSFWDHFPVIVKVEAKDRRTKKGMKGWAGCIPRSEVEKSKFQELVLCPSGDTTDIRKDEHDGLVAQQERLEEAAAAVKATTTAVRNRNKFTVPDEIREMAAEAAKCRGPVRRKRARKSRREFEAGRAVLPRGKVTHRPVVTKLWINGRAREDRDEWTEEVSAHCEKCFDDKTETSEVHTERIRHQRSRGDRLAVLKGRHIQISVDRVLSARAKMMKNKANGPADCLVKEMLQCTRSRTSSRSGSRESVGPQRRGKFFALSIALLSVFSKWCTTVLVDLLQEEKEPIEWRSLHVTHAGRGNEFIPETLGMAVGRSDRFAARMLQIQNGVHGKFGREDGV